MLVSSVLIVICLIAADIATKNIICTALAENGGPLRFIPHILRFEYVENTGMAWGMFKNGTVVLSVLTVLACAGIVFFLIKKGRQMPLTMRLGFLMILAGALGNLIDRIFLGYVRDFIAFDFFDFPIFNFADCCVTIGGILLFASLILTKKGRDFYKNLDAKDEKKDEKNDEKERIE